MDDLEVTETLCVDRPPSGYLSNLSVDCIVLSIKNGRVMVLSAKYNEGYAKGLWGLIGGWVKVDEDTDQAANRLLHSITGVDNMYLEQLRAFGAPKRFPPRRVITIAYFALVRPELYNIIPGGTASHLAWRDARSIENLIYDHSEILANVLTHLQRKIRHEPIGFNLLPAKFTLLQLQEVYEALLNTTLDKPNFRRKINKMNLLINCNEKQVGVNHRAASLYRFDLDVYEKLSQHGMIFEV